MHRNSPTLALGEEWSEYKSESWRFVGAKRWIGRTAAWLFWLFFEGFSKALHGLSDHFLLMVLEHAHVMPQIAEGGLARVLAKAFPFLISVLLHDCRDWRVLLVLHVVEASDPQTQQHLHELPTCTPDFLGAVEGQSSPQLSVLILNLSDILFLPVPRVLGRHPVSLLLLGLLRLVVVNKGRQLRLLQFYLSPNRSNLLLSLSLGLGRAFGLGVLSLEG